MKPKRNVRSKPVPAKVISLVAYRNAHRRSVPEPSGEQVGPRDVTLMDAYCRWLAVVGAVWAFWW